MKLHNGHINRARTLAALAVAVAVVYFTSILAGQPVSWRLSGSLLAPEVNVVGLLGVVAAAMLCLAVGVLLCAKVRIEAPLFVVAAATYLFSYRGGRVQVTLLNQERQVYITLALEMLLLGLLLAACWFILHLLRGRMLHPGEHHYDTVEIKPAPPLDHLQATVAHAVITCIAMLILCRSDAKLQAGASVLISSLVATLITHRIFPLPQAIAYAMGPVLAGVLGYLLAYLSPAGLSIGVPSGLSGPLVRALPLDYATVGVAAAIYGVWMRRRTLRQQREASPQQPATSSP